MQSRTESLEQLIWEMRRLFRELQTAADRELDAVGIGTADRALIEFLARETAPVSFSDLARKYSLTRQHIHQTLRRLPNREWVDQIPDPNDGRIVLLRLSRKGRQIWNRVRELDRAFLSKLAERFSQGRLTAATEVLRQLRRELAAAEESNDEQE